MADLDPVTQEILASAFRHIAEEMAVVEYRSSYSPIIREMLVARTSDVQQSFKDVRDSIIERLSSEYVEKKVGTHTDELRNQKIEANADLVASLRDRFGVAPNVPDTSVTPSP